MGYTSNLKVGGGVIFWTLAQWSNRDSLLGGLTAIGLNKLCPPVRSIPHCLRSALGQVFKRAHLIQPLKGGGLEVREVIHLDDDTNEHQLRLTAKIDGDERISLRPYDADWAEAIQESYRQARGMVSADAVSDALTKHIDTLGGTRLRPMGGIYWLREGALVPWQQVTSAVEQSAARGRSSCYLLRHEMDHDAIRAVRDAIVMEVTASAQDLHDQVVSGTLGERALHHREEEAQALREKIKLYESILGEGLSSLHDAVDNAEQAAAAAAILASSQAGAEVA